MKKQELIDRVEALAQELAQGFGYEIVDVDYVKEGPNWYLKVFADKEGGFSIKDKDFARSIGKLVEIRLFATTEELPDKNFTAQLKAYDPEKGAVTLETEDGKEVSILKKDLAGIRLAVVF